MKKILLPALAAALCLCSCRNGAVDSGAIVKLIDKDDVEISGSAYDMLTIYKDATITIAPSENEEDGWFISVEVPARSIETCEVASVSCTLEIQDSAGEMVPGTVRLHPEDDARVASLFGSLVPEGAIFFKGGSGLSEEEAREIASRIEYLCLTVNASLLVEEPEPEEENADSLFAGDSLSLSQDSLSIYQELLNEAAEAAEAVIDSLIVAVESGLQEN